MFTSLNSQLEPISLSKYTQTCKGVSSSRLFTLTLVFFIASSIAFQITPVRATYTDSDRQRSNPIISPANKDTHLLPSATLANSIFTYRVPWPSGWQAYVGQTAHEGGAFDFNILVSDDRYSGDWITAAYDGIVVYVKDVSNNARPVGENNCYRWANMVVIGHGDYNPATKRYQEYSWYTHLAVDSVPERVIPGEPILAGEPIGQEGATGCTSGTVHLHFAISDKFPSATRFFPQASSIDQATGAVLQRESYPDHAAWPVRNDVLGINWAMPPGCSLAARTICISNNDVADSGGVTPYGDIEHNGVPLRLTNEDIPQF